MKAKRMFEKLGLKFSEDEESIIYSNLRVEINFDKNVKIYTAYCYNKKGCGILAINRKLNKAIQQQIKELGWEE